MSEDNPYAAGLELSKNVRDTWGWMGGAWPILVMLVALNDTIKRLPEREARIAIRGLRNTLDTLEKVCLTQSSP